MKNTVNAMAVDLSHQLHERLNDHDRSLMADAEMLQKALAIRLASGMNGAEAHVLLERLKQGIDESMAQRARHIRTHDLLDKLATRMDFPTDCPKPAAEKKADCPTGETVE